MTCTAHRTNGDPCKARAIKGSNVCVVHGGAAPQVRAAARQRLLEAADRAAADLVAISRDRKQPGAVRVAAVKSILDRAGVPEIRRDELTGLDGAPVTVDYTRLSEERLAQLEAILFDAIVVQPAQQAQALAVRELPAPASPPAANDDDGEKLT